MATVTSAAVTIPSFAGLKSIFSPARPVSVAAKPPCSLKLAVRASLKDVGVAVAATAASAVLASNAMAIEVLLGVNGGSLVFSPSEFSVSKGEEIVFKNNEGYPHNVIFDEDEVPSGVDASAISMEDGALLNAPGETFVVKLTEPGTYGFYCSPHQGAGMVGKVTVN